MAEQSRTVYIAHTSELAKYPAGRSFVAAAEAAVIAADRVPAEMSRFGAHSEEPAEVCRQRVGKADVLVLIAGFRYGTPVRDRPQLSYTELEYETARQKAKPTLVYLLGKKTEGPRQLHADRKFGKRQKRFRKRLLEEVTAATVTSPEELEKKLYRDLLEVSERGRGGGHGHERQLDATRRIARQREAEFRDHVLPRARGVDTTDQDTADFGGEWLFSGRDAALSDAVRWIKADGPPTLVVTGAPGSGKSALLAVLSVLADPEHRDLVPATAIPMRLPVPPGAINRFIHARGLTAEEVVAGLCEATDIDVTSTPGEFLERLQGQEGDPVVVVIDAVDEAADRSATEHTCGLDEVLKPLIGRLHHTRLRLLIGTRRQLLGPLGVLADRSARATLIDLDSESYADPEGVRSYVDKWLRSDGSPYRQADPDQVRAVGNAVAAAAGGSFLVAQITAVSLALGAEVVDPTDPRWRAGLSSEAAGAMRADLQRRLGEQAQRAFDLLLPLAYAKGPGLPWAGIWPTLCTVLTAHPCSDDELAWLRRHLSGYLTEAIAEDQRTAVYRLFHESLAQHLRSGRDQVADEARITRELVRLVHTKNGGDWAAADPYIRAHLAAHAAAGSVLDDLLGDIDVLLHADPAGLAPRLSSATTEDGKLSAAIYLASLNLHRYVGVDRRRTLLAIDAARYGAPDLVARLAAAGPSRRKPEWRPRWATGSRLHAGQRYTLPRQLDRIPAVACGDLDGAPTAAIACRDGSVRLWNMDSGEAIGASWTVPGGDLRAVACTGGADGPLVVTGGADGIVYRWDPSTGRRAEQVFAVTAAVQLVTCLKLAVRPVVVIGGADGSACVGDLDIGGAVFPPLPALEDRPSVTTCTRLEDRWVLVQAGRRIVLRDLETGDALGDPIEAGHAGPVTAMACAQLNGAPVMVTTGDDRVMHVRDLLGRELVSPTRFAEPGPRSALACSVVNDTPVAVISDGDCLQIRDLRSGRLIGTPLAGHTQPITAVSCLTIDDRPLAVTGCKDGTGRIWDLDVSVVGSAHRSGHSRKINAVTCLTVNGRQLAVTASEDRATRIWDLETGEPAPNTLAKHVNSVNAVAATMVRETPVVVTGSADRTARLTDVTTGAHLAMHGELAGAVRSPAASQRIDALACGVLDGVPVAVTACRNGEVQLWDVRTGQRRSAPLPDLGRILAVAVTDPDDGTGPVAILGYVDGTVRPWWLPTARFTAWPSPGNRNRTGYLRAVTTARLRGDTFVIGGGSDGQVFGRRPAVTGPRLLSEPAPRWTQTIRAIAVTEVDGRVVAVSGAEDGVVRVWELDGDGDTIRKLADLPTGSAKPVLAVGCTEVDGRVVAVSGGADGVLRIWDLTTLTLVGELASGVGTVRAIACTEVDGTPIAVAGCDRGQVQVWDLLGRRQRGVHATGTDDVVRALALCEVDGRTVVVAGADGDTIHRWDLASDITLTPPPAALLRVDDVPARDDGGFPSRITAVACSRIDGRSLAALGDDEGQAWIWPLDGFPSHPDPVMLDVAGRIAAVALGQVNGRPMAAFGSGDGTMRIWDVDRTRLARPPFIAEALTLRAAACATIQGRPTLLTAGDECAVHLWALPTGEPVGRLVGHTRPIQAIAYGTVRHEPVVVTGGDDRTIRVWDPRTLDCLGRIPMPAFVFALAVSDDGAIIACVDRDVVILDLGPGAGTAHARAHQGKRGSDPVLGHVR